MSTRERWILYPLLFLTLGTVMRDKFFGQKDFKALDVTAPEVTAENVTAYREITAHTIHCTQLEVGKLECRGIAVLGPNKSEAVRVGVVPDRGGRIELCCRDIRENKEIWLAMGYEDPYYGVFAKSPELGRGLPLTLPWRLDGQPTPGQPPNEGPSDKKPPPGQAEPSDAQPPRVPDG